MQQCPCSYFELGLPVNGWLAYRLTIWLINWLANCLNGWLTDGLTIWLINWLAHCLHGLHVLSDGQIIWLINSDWLTGHPSSQRRRSWSSIQQLSTITSFSSKLCEKIILEQFSAYFMNNNSLLTKAETRNYILQRHWTFISQNIINYTEGHRQKEDHS